MKRHAPRFVAGLILLLGSGVPARADLIRYTWLVTMSGALDGTDFRDATVTISSTADTEAIVADGAAGAYAADLGEVTVQIATLGVKARFIGPTHLQLQSVRGSGVSLRDAATETVVAAVPDARNRFNLAGNHVRTGSAVSDAVEGLRTDRGSLSFRDARGSVRFTAVRVAPVPEPTTLIAAGLGGALLALLASYRYRSPA